MLNRELIFARKPKIKKVEIKSMGGDLYVKEFIVSERNKLRDTESNDYQSITIILGICDKDGTPMFTSDDLDNIASLPQKVADELFFAVVECNETSDSTDTAKN